MSITIKPGVYVSLITPFDENENIDYQNLENLINFHKIKNTTGIVLLGTTGESPTLTTDEKFELVKFVSQRKEHLSLIVGVGGNCTRDVKKFTVTCNQYADGLMVTVPNYNKPMQEGIYQHFKVVADSTNLPIMMYNIPSRCGVNMNTKTIIRLYNQCENIVAIKEASGDLGQIQDIMKGCKILIYAGDDSQLVPIMSLGGSGVVSVYANIEPNSVYDTYYVCIQNKYEESRYKYFSYHEEIKKLFVETNPIPLKKIMANRGMIKKVFRLPLM